MNDLASRAPGPQASDTLLASRRHTLIFFAICLAVTVVSALNANRGAAPGTPASSNQLLQVYLVLIAMEWLWVRFVYKGMQAHGRSLFEFIGQPWSGLRQLAGDLMYAALALGFSYLCFTGIERLLQHGQAVTNPLLPAVPSGAVAITVWIGLSLSAGICEEIVFRGYLQRQLAAISGSTGLAILGQALVFGIAHGYEGLGAVIRIVVYGLAFGMLAQWRGNIRAGILAHAAWDILAGLDLI
jgi:membrane protease YdiL (CAAX protease family)